MRPGGGASKGSSFERKICKELSLAWTGGARDDVFWRTSGSGARATVRMARGRTTAHQYGDICAVDPVGFPLMARYVFELKCGYDWDITDLLEGKGKLVEFLDQVLTSRKDAEQAQPGAGDCADYRVGHSCVLVAKRNRCGTVVFCDDDSIGGAPLRLRFRGRWWHVMPWRTFVARAVKPNPA